MQDRRRAILQQAATVPPPPASMMAPSPDLATSPSGSDPHPPRQPRSNERAQARPREVRAVPRANITVVRSAAELQAAAEAKAQDIEIRAHLDLRKLRRLQNPLVTSAVAGSYALLYADPPLRSIRVRSPIHRACMRR